MVVLNHLNSVGKWLGECGQDGIDSFQEGWSLRSPSWHVTKALVNQPHQGMVIANLLEILCPVFNFRDWDHGIVVSWIRTKTHPQELATSHRGCGSGVLWFCHESLWWHV